MRKNKTSCPLAGLAAVIGLAFGPSPGAHADEGGVGFWLPGQYSSFAAIPATPGASVTLMPYYYSGSAGGSKLFRAGEITLGLDTQAPLMLVQLGYATESKLWGGQPFFGLAFGVGKNTTSIDATLTDATTSVARSVTQSKSGGTDLYPIASLAWNAGNDNLMTYVTGDIPVGAYDSQRLANLGIGHAAIDLGGAYTYFNEKSGFEASATAGFTYNWKNPDTDYRNGNDFHVDWAVSQFVSAQWQLGVVGYVYQQLSADSYPTSGATGALRAQALGSFKSSVASVGPEVGYMFMVGKKQAYANVRGYWEFGAQNRVEGYTLLATINLPLGD